MKTLETRGFTLIVLFLLTANVGLGFLLWKRFVEAPAAAHDIVESIVGYRSEIPANSPAKVPRMTFHFLLPRGSILNFLRISSPRLASAAGILGKPCRVEFARDPLEVISKVEEDPLAVGSLKPMAFAMNRKGRKVKAVLEQGTKTPKRSLIVVRKDSPFEDVQSLAGKKIAFESRDSLSGYAFPLKDLSVKGFSPTHHFGVQLFTGNSRNSVLGVISGENDAAVVSNSFYEELEKPIQQQLRSVYSSEPIPGAVFFISEKADPAVATGLASAMARIGEGIPRGYPYSTFFHVGPPREDLIKGLENGVIDDSD